MPSGCDIPPSSTWYSRSDSSPGSPKATGSRARGFDLKEDAIDHARNLAYREDLSQVEVQKSDGTIETECTYGEDPHPPGGLSLLVRGFRALTGWSVAACRRGCVAGA